MDTDKLADLAEKWGSATMEAIGKYGPDAARLAETVARLDAIRYLAAGAGTAVLGAVVARYAQKKVSAHIAETKAIEGKSYDFTDCNPFFVMSLGGIGLIAALLGAAGLSDLINPMAWAGAFEPKVWIVAKLLKL
jgi:hypothetical protein